MEKKPPVNNTWTEIIELTYFEIDRFEGSNIKYKETEKNDEEKVLSMKFIYRGKKIYFAQG